MENIVVRFITESDKKQLEELYIQIIQEEFHHFPKKLKDYYAFSEYKDRMLTLSTLIGGFLDERMIGFLMVDRPIGGVLYAHWIGVSKAYQKKGVGKKMLVFLEQYALKHNVHDIHLEAAADQKNYYLKLGYKQYGYDEKGYFGLSLYQLKKVLQEPQAESFLK